MTEVPKDPPTDLTQLTLAEVPLARMGPGGDLRPSFVGLQRPWTRRGVHRWLDLVDPAGRWPVAVLGALPASGAPALAGALVALWASEPLERFDDLFDRPRGPAGDASRRPQGGIWHFISVTTDPRARGADLGRRLVEVALDWVRATSGADEARTLSPAVGLPDLAKRVAPGAPFERAAMVALRAAAREDGSPVMPIVRLHLGAGAWLERVLFDSRRDDVDSGAVTLRFAYAVDAHRRDAQRRRYGDWCAARARAVAAGQASPGGEGVWLAPDRVDADLVAGAVDQGDERTVGGRP